MKGFRFRAQPQERHAITAIVKWGSLKVWMIEQEWRQKITRRERERGSESKARNRMRERSGCIGYLKNVMNSV